MFWKKKKKEEEDPQIPVEALCLWVHRRDFLTCFRRREELEGRASFRMMSPCDPLGVTVGLTGQQGVLPAADDILEKMGLSFEEAFQIAMKNTVSRITQVQSLQGLRVLQTGHDEAGAAIIAARIILPKLGLEGRPVAMFPEANVAFFASEDDHDALWAMQKNAENIYRSSPEFRTLRAMTFDEEGQASEWLPPLDHPLADVYRDSALYTRNQDAAMVAKMWGVDVLAPNAHLSTQPSSRGGKYVASWARDTSVMIPPDVEDIVLLDTDDRGRPAVQVPLALMLERCPSAFEVVNQDMIDAATDGGSPAGDSEGPHLFYRARAPSFPSARMLEFLQNTTAFEAANPGAKDSDVDAEELLAEWDKGEAIAFDVIEPETVELRAADRRTAKVAVELVRDRIAHLDSVDQFTLENGLVTFKLMEAVDRGEDMSAVMESARSSVEPLLIAIEKERPLLMSSLAASTVRELAVSDNSDDAQQTIERMNARKLEPVTLFPVLRPADFENVQTAYMDALAASHGMTMATAPANIGGKSARGLNYEIVSDDDTQRSPVTEDQFNGEDVDVVKRTAMLNLRAASAGGLVRLGKTTAHRGAWRDGYAASRILAPDVFDVLGKDDDLWVFTPTIDTLWVAKADDHEGIETVLDDIGDYFKEVPEAQAAYAWREMLFATPWTLKGSEVSANVRPLTIAQQNRVDSIEADMSRLIRASMQFGEGV